MRASFDALAAIGATPAGGVTRLALGDQDRRARDLLVAWCREAGWDVRWDDLGTISAWRPARAATKAPVLVGSHLDSVERGGRFDGALGVVAALEVLRTLDDLGLETARPVVLVDFTNEEGARFEPPMACSGVLAGRFDAGAVRANRDRSGVEFGAELERIGYAGEEAARLPVQAASFELHIEQGPVLEAAAIPVGIVSGIQGITWSDVVFTGDSSHAGATPMDVRRDALVAAGRFLADLPALAARHGGFATAGRITAEPGIVNVIPGRVRVGLDLRHPEAAGLEALLEDARRGAPGAAFDTFWTSPPTAFDAGLMAGLESAAAALGVSTRRLVSGPGHDSKYLAERGPAAMVFVRTERGRSHCEDESARWEDCVMATDVLLQAVIAAAIA